MRWTTGALGMIVLVALTACSSTTGTGTGTETGTVSVEIGGDAFTELGESFPVTITDATGQVVVDEVMARGQSRGFDDIPLGEVSITIGDACILTTTLNTEGATASTHSPKSCEIGD